LKTRPELRATGNWERATDDKREADVLNSVPFGGSGGPSPENLGAVFNAVPFNAAGFGGADMSPALESISAGFNAAPFNSLPFGGSVALNEGIVPSPARRTTHQRWFSRLLRPVARRPR
jgi:hypothetical protein